MTPSPTESPTPEATPTPSSTETPETALSPPPNPAENPPPKPEENPPPNAEENPPSAPGNTDYRFTAERTEQKIVLDGLYPNEATHQQILALAKRLFPTEELEDNLKALPGESPLGFIDGINLGLAQLSRMQSGVLDLGRGRMKLTGDAFYQKDADEILQTLKDTLPPNAHSELTVGVAASGPELTPEEAQTLFTATLAKGTVLFDSGTADLSADSKGFLDQLIAIARRCPQAKLEIAGYTDTSGDADSNLKLSQQRAEAVVRYLVQEGLPAESLTAVGFGENNPIAPNDTEEGKARNRRIEIHVR
ncbi:MAG: OmpA family protein [Verrucomicrobia bacterium]|nr:OmpA family protein [Verrucomicrobiota bacterium]